jgi:hypothetical protein
MTLYTAGKFALRSLLRPRWWSTVEGLHHLPRRGGAPSGQFFC